MTARRLFCLLAIGAISAATPLGAQELAPTRHVSFNTGLFQFKLDGNGLAPLLSVRGATPVNNVLLLEGSLLAARPGQDLGTTTFLIPEFQLQLVVPFTEVKPYFGLGTGAAIDLRDSANGGAKTVITISGAIGVKAWLSGGVGIQGEYRGRGIDPEFTGSASEYTLGLIWRM